MRNVDKVMFGALYYIWTAVYSISALMVYMGKWVRLQWNELLLPSDRFSDVVGKDVDNRNFTCFSF